MRKTILIFLLSFFSLMVSTAQNVGINSSGAAPDASSMLDVASTNKGVLIPRVDIDDLTTEAPVSSATTSLLVYNTNTTTGPGYFYWDGTRWAKISTKIKYSGSVSSGNWYRIATNSGNRADASFTLTDAISGGGHSTMRFNAGVNYGDASGISFSLLSHSRYSTATFTKVRIIENGTYDGAHLEVYCNRSGSVAFFITDNEQNSGWIPVNWTAGSIPSGWTVHEYETDRIFALGASDDLVTVNRSGYVGIGDATPSNKLSVGASSQFQVSSTGDLVKVDNVTYNWPNAQGDANTLLTNDGSGNLSWEKMGWGKLSDIELTNVTSYTVSGLDGNTDVAYKIVLMGQQVSSSTEVCYISINNDGSTSNYEYGIDAYWGYTGSYSWDYDAYDVGGVFLWATFGGYDPNYVESETLLSSFTGNRRHCVSRYSLGMSSNYTFVNLSAGVWNNTSTNITSLVFHWSSNFTGRLIIYATH